jgi:hypothetical protein
MFLLKRRSLWAQMVRNNQIVVGIDECHFRVHVMDVTRKYWNINVKYYKHHNHYNNNPIFNNDDNVR